MAVWFATANGNINSAGRWNSLPGGGGSTLTWPAASDDVLMANGRTVTINVNTVVGEVRNDTANGATVGGSFALSAGVSFTGNGYAGPGGSGAITFSAATGFLVGNFYGGSGSGSAGVIATGTGTLTITGNIYGGASGTSCAGARNSGTGTINVVGNAMATSANQGAWLSAGGTFTVSGYVQSTTTGYGAVSAAQGILQVGETRSGSNGLPGILGAFRFASATAAKTIPYTPDGQISMTVLDVDAIVPAESDVRQTVIYGDGSYTGTLPLGRSRVSMAGRF